VRRALIGLLALACLAGAARGQDAGALAMVLMGQGSSFRSPADLNPVAWWKCDGNATDSVGTNNGTWFGAAAYSNGVNGQSFSFGGVTAVTIGKAASSWPAGALVSTNTSGTSPFYYAIGPYTGTLWQVVGGGR